MRGSYGGIYTALRAHLFIIYDIHCRQSAHFSASHRCSATCSFERVLPIRFDKLLRTLPRTTATLFASCCHNVCLPRNTFPTRRVVPRSPTTSHSNSKTAHFLLISLRAHVHTLTCASSSQYSCSSAPCDNAQRRRFPFDRCRCACALHCVVCTQDISLYSTSLGFTINLFALRLQRAVYTVRELDETALIRLEIRGCFRIPNCNTTWSKATSKFDERTILHECSVAR